MDEANPPGKHIHNVLTVGNIPNQSRDIGPLLHGMGIEFVHVQSADQAVRAVAKAPVPYSLIVCDQRLQGMKGTQLLAQVKKAAPETIRFLITRYSDMATIILAVNKGSVHRYISMPWDESRMTEALRSGLASYEHHLESEKLFGLAKRQNAKLYELNCQLMETAQRHSIESKALENEIAGLKAALKEKTGQRPLSAKKLAAIIFEAVQNTLGDPGDMLDTLYTQSICSLHWTFSDFAMRNGFEMPEPVPGDSSD